MSLVPAQSTPAGWYPDPAGLNQQRWWDGTSWTNNIATGQIPRSPESFPSSYATAAPPLPSRRELRHNGAPLGPMRTNQFALPAAATSEPAFPQHQAFPPQPALQAQPGPPALPAQPALQQQPTFPQLQAQQHATQPMAQSPFVPSIVPTPPVGNPTIGSMTAVLEREEVPYQPFGMVPEISRGVAAPPEIVYTGSVWGIALTPLLVGALGFGVIVGAREFYSSFAQGGLAFILVLVTVALAVRDRRTLLEAGYRTAASPAWLLLSPLGYFIARSVQTKKAVSAGIVPLVVWVLGVAALVAAGITNPEWVQQLLLLP